MLPTTTLEQITCYAIVIAMAVIIFKAFSYPLGNFLNTINPFYYRRRFERMSQRLEEVEMERYNTNKEIIDLKKLIQKNGKGKSN